MLIVDTDASRREALVGLLGTDCCEVLQAEDGRTATVAVLRHKPWLMLIAGDFVDQPGSQLARRLRALGEEARIVLVGAVDAHTDKAQLSATLDAGASVEAIAETLLAQVPDRSAPTALVPEDGSHSRVTWLRLLRRFSEQEATGLLSVHAPRGLRRLYLDRGRACWFVSNVPGEPQELEGRDAGVGAPLTWTRGSWIFQPDVEPPEGATPSSTPIMTSLLRGVLDHVDSHAALPIVVDPQAGSFSPTPELMQNLIVLPLDEPIAPMLLAVAAGESLQNLSTQFPGHWNTLLLLLWFLEAVDLLRRDSGARPELSLELEPRTVHQPERASRHRKIGEAQRALARSTAEARSVHAAGEAQPVTITTEQPTEAPHTPQSAASDAPRQRADAPKPKRRDPEATRMREIARSIRADHDKRMGRNLYGFLGLPRSVGAGQIEQAIARFERRWAPYSEHKRMPRRGREQAAELVKALHHAKDLLLDPQARASYDADLKAGGTTAAEGLIAVGSGPDDLAPKRSLRADLHREGREASQAGDHRRAMAKLKQAQVHSPDDPELLADLGWATWMAKGEAGQGEAEGYLDEALRISPSHPMALQFLARIGVEMGDPDEARRRLRRLLAVSPKDPWALKQLERYDA